MREEKGEKKMREKIMEIENLSSSGKACDAIRREVFRELSEKWQDTPEKRKAYRAIMCALDTRISETRIYHVKCADEIIGNQDW